MWYHVPRRCSSSPPPRRRRRVPRATLRARARAAADAIPPVPHPTSTTTRAARRMSSATRGERVHGRKCPLRAYTAERRVRCARWHRALECGTFRFQRAFCCVLDERRPEKAPCPRLARLGGARALPARRARDESSVRARSARRARAPRSRRGERARDAAELLGDGAMRVPGAPPPPPPRARRPTRRRTPRRRRPRASSARRARLETIVMGLNLCPFARAALPAPSCR